MKEKAFAVIASYESVVWLNAQWTKRFFLNYCSLQVSDLFRQLESTGRNGFMTFPSQSKHMRSRNIISNGKMRFFFFSLNAMFLRDEGNSWLSKDSSFIYLISIFCVSVVTTPLHLFLSDAALTASPTVIPVHIDIHRWSSLTHLTLHWTQLRRICPK